MSILDRLLFLIGLRPQPGSRTYEISESLQATLTTLAQHESRPVDELIPDLLAAGLTQYRTTDELWKLWESLTARERDVVALACLEYSNREIGLRLGISYETVKTRLQSALKKFNVHSRHELRLMLVVNARWDFSAWERQS
jgi:DNA-binding CsgD family transcriptional regulator